MAQGAPSETYVARNGAILLGHHVSCDQCDISRRVAVFTHIHKDHIKGFANSLGRCEAVIISPQTRDILVAFKGKYLLEYSNLVALEFGQHFTFEDERITLFPVRHVLGAAQVLVETADGVRMLYTGEFCWPDTTPVEADTVVIDATYGNPSFVRAFSRESMEQRFVELVSTTLKHRPAHIFTERGKAQELMNLLYTNGVRVPTLCGREDDHKLAKVYEKYGFPVGECLSLKDSKADDILKSGQPHLLFQHIGDSVISYEPQRYLRIKVSAWDTLEPFYEKSPGSYVVAISSHADFCDLLLYLAYSGPNLVVTDNSRDGNAITLAEHVSRRLSMQAVPQPT